MVEVGAQVGLELQRVAVEPGHQAVEFHTLERKAAQVDVAPAVAAGHVVVGVVAHAFAQRMLRDGHVVIVHVGQPVDHVLAAVEARAARRVAGGEVDLAPGQVQVFGDLRARLAAAHHQHRAIGQLRRVAVLRRVVLHDRSRQLLGHARHHRLVVAARGHHHLVGGEAAGAGVDRVAVRLAGLRHLLDRHALEGRRLHLLDEAGQPGVDLVLDHEAVRIVAAVRPARQVALPVGRDEAEGIPALHAPACASRSRGGRCRAAAGSGSATGRTGRRRR